MWFDIALGVISGLGLFLVGIGIMSEGLQKSAGNKLKSFIEKVTSNRLVAVAVGTVVTMIVQSSSATSVMLVGLVNSGVMQLSQAVGVIMGANIGTTITSQLISLNIDVVAPLAVGIGFVMKMVSKKARTKHLGDILIGLGMLFIGMGLLKNSLGPLKKIQWFKDLLVNFQYNPLMGILTGFLVTLILQSSSASMGLLIALASEGMIPFASALYILYGDNIGTCTTALISSIGSSKNAKRVAIMHLSFNVIGTIIFSLFMRNIITGIVTHLNPDNVQRQLANAHSLFNLINVILLFPFANALIRISQFIVRDGTSQPEESMTSFLDRRMLKTPPIALRNALLETVRMAKIAENSVTYSILSLENSDKDMILRSLEQEHNINRLQKEIMSYLLALSNAPGLGEEERKLVDNLFTIINDIERIGDHAENITELATIFIDQQIEFDPQALIDAKRMYDKILEGYRLSIEAFGEGNMEKANRAISLEKEIDRLEESARNSHISRMHAGNASIDSGIIFLDLLSNLERISDHFKKIGHLVIKEKGRTRIQEPL